MSPTLRITPCEEPPDSAFIERGEDWIAVYLEQVGLRQQLVTTIEQRRAILRQIIVVQQTRLAYCREVATLRRLVEGVSHE
jgi:heme exporter protein D